MAAPSNSEEPPQLKIYFLPNLLTAGNLFCGFLAITRIVEADLQPPYSHIKEALFYILLACIFDLFDGRVARMGGRESPFGREFDSLADVVSFGVAPAFLVHRVVLRDVFENMPEIGWFIASLYLICGALRLARFNCLAAQPGNTGGGNEFMGFPIPAAAGLVASLTLLLMWWDEQNFAKANWRFLLPGILMFLLHDGQRGEVPFLQKTGPARPPAIRQIRGLHHRGGGFCVRLGKHRAGGAVHRVHHVPALRLRAPLHDQADAS
jgi:CDP-diacylglycerol---serine O-phosphatidyltransferase